MLILLIIMVYGHFLYTYKRRFLIVSASQGDSIEEVQSGQRGLIL